MAAIEASSVGVKTMADGTLRLSVDIEPMHAQAAFALFGKPGQPLALAALKPASSKPEPERKGGEIAKWLGIKCGEERFHDWLFRYWPKLWDSCMKTHGGNEPEAAAEVVRRVCAVESRIDLDHDAEAARRFHTLIREPFKGKA